MEIVENKNYSYENYKNDIIKTYKDERLETYYYRHLINFLESIYYKDEKVINVSENKKKKGLHAKVQSVYADRGELPDFIIVPMDYSYENPKKPYITIEVKRPEIDIEGDLISRYNKLKIEKNNKQLNSYFKKTSYIIFTDTITWYLLIKEDKSILKQEFSLVEKYQEKWGWKRKTNRLVSDEEKEFFNSMDFNTTEISEGKIEPVDWGELTKELSKLLNKSKKNYEINKKY